MPSFESALPENFIRTITDEYMPSLKEKYPYTSEFFATNLRVYSPSQNDIHLATASIESLKPYVDPSIDLSRNCDLLGVVFNAFVVNRVNKNDQVIATNEALAAVADFKYKPINIEHDREKVAGMITGYGFSEFGTDKVLTLDEVKGMTEPFNVFLRGFIWRVVNPDFADKLEEASDPTSDLYQKISASWEMGFKEFSLVKGSKNLNECTAVAVDSIDEVKAMLKHFGGTGVDGKGERVFMQMQGEVLPLGVGFTSNPAAEVKGVAALTGKNEAEQEKAAASVQQQQTQENSAKQQESTTSSQNNEENDDSDEKKSKKISQEENTPVSTNITNQTFAMFKDIKDITDDALKQAKASDVTTFIESKLKEASTQWATEKAAKEQEVSNAAKAAEDAKKELETLKADADAIRTELAQLKAAAEQKAKDEAFQTRMAGLDAEFNLDDADRQVIGEQITNLDEEGFNKWLASFSVIAKDKKKAAKTDAAKKEDAKDGGADDDQEDENGNKVAKKSVKKASEAKASEQQAAEAIEAAKAKAGQEVPNNGGQATTPTLTEKWAKAFSKDTVKVTR